MLHYLINMKFFLTLSIQSSFDLSIFCLFLATKLRPIYYYQHEKRVTKSRDPKCCFYKLKVFSRFNIKFYKC